MVKKLRSDRGESLIEVLASILIAALSVALLFSSVITSSKIDKGKETDEKHYQALTAAATYTTPVTTGTVEITRTDVSPAVTASSGPTVEIYGGEGVYSYK